MDNSLSLDRPELFINRQLSWLAFNQRVLELASRPTFPLLERLRFLAIFSSNLDEFFMIRVAGLFQQLHAGIALQDPSGMTVSQQLAAIQQTTRNLMDKHSCVVQSVLEQLRAYHLVVLNRNEWTTPIKRYCSQFFQEHLSAVLTPIAIEQISPPPLLAGLQINIAVTVENTNTPELLIVPVPTSFSRFVAVPSRQGSWLAALEDIIIDNIHYLCAGKKILSVDVFRLTRDADISVQDDEAADLLEVIEQAVRQRRRRAVVRVETNDKPHSHLLQWLKNTYQLTEEDIFAVRGRLQASAYMELVERNGFDHLKNKEWPALKPIDLQESDTIWQAISQRDILLCHPYERFDPVIDLLKQAAVDPNVLAIKQTLYRTSGQSPIIDALEQAALNGKEVTVLVELKARFDETRNVAWARRLEDAGCHVIYGLAGLKTHAKLLLIVRREAGRIRRYVHLATGNYNDKTARVYSDIGLLTVDGELGSDVTNLFNWLTGFSEGVAMEKLTVAPISLRHRVVELIDREIAASSKDKPGFIMIKVNALEDPTICKALYRASQAGVRIRLNIRGICCLRPGIKGISENIEVVSILDRYLEHARIYYFNNAGHPEIYLSSADLMMRNLDKRVETFFPILNPEHQKRIIQMLNYYFEDNTNSWRLKADGQWEATKPSRKPLSAQAAIYQMLQKLSQQKQSNINPFRPIKSIQ